MQDHPVPQNVTSYQFRLVGNMTLKQFLELGAGLLVAYLFFASNLYFFLKWPLAILSLFLGIALAFFPVEERPLDQWLISFLKAIYAPTRYTWKKSPSPIKIFDYTPPQKQPESKPSKIKKSASERIEAYSVPEKLSALDLKLNSKEAEIAGLLSKLPTLPLSDASSFDIPSKPSVKIRQLSSPESLGSNIIFNSGKPILPTTSASIATQPESTIIFDKSKTDSDNEMPEPEATPDSDNILLTNAKQKSQKSISIPQSRPASVEHNSETVYEEESTAPESAQLESDIISKPTATVRQIQEDVQKATTIDDYMPITPKTPNIVVGVVTDPAGGIVENAIIQISDPKGIPVRAVKTNQLGQFAISTPLSKGEYIIEVEGESHTYPVQKLKVNNKIINPILIKATA